MNQVKDTGIRDTSPQDLELKSKTGNSNSTNYTLNITVQWAQVVNSGPTARCIDKVPYIQYAA